MNDEALNDMTQHLKILKANSVLAAGVPFLILTAYPGSAKQAWEGEHFLFVEGERTYFDQQHTTVNAQGVPDTLVTLDENYMFVELKQNVDAMLSRYLGSLAREQREYGYLSRAYEFYTVAETEWKRELLAFWRRGIFTAQLTTVKENTKCQELKNVLMDCANYFPPSAAHRHP